MTATGPYQVAPPLAADDLDRLRQSIIDHGGIMVPIRVDEAGVIIDGHHRAMIAQDLGIDCPREIVSGLSDDQKVEMARTLNRDRRHLDREQKRKMIAASLVAEPELSDRQHAAKIGVSPTTVGTVRSGLEASGDVSKLDTRTDTAGRKQAAAKVPAEDRRSPLPDTAFRAGYKFRKAVESIGRLPADDRFGGHREEMAALLLGDIDYALDVLTDLRRLLLEDEVTP